MCMERDSTWFGNQTPGMVSGRLFRSLQAPKAKKKAKATLGVGKASKRAVDLADLDNDLGAEFDDFM